MLRHLFRTNIRNLQESLRNIYEKLRGFIRSGLSGKVTDEEDLENHKNRCGRQRTASASRFYIDNCLSHRKIVNSFHCYATYLQ